MKIITLNILIIIFYLSFEINAQSSIIVLNYKDNDTIHIYKNPFKVTMWGVKNCDTRYPVISTKILVDTFTIIFSGLLEYSTDSILMKKLPVKINFGNYKCTHEAFGPVYKNVFQLISKPLYKQIENTNEFVITDVNDDISIINGYLIMDMYWFDNKISQEGLFFDHVCFQAYQQYHPVIYKMKVKYIFNNIPCDISNNE